MVKTVSVFYMGKEYQVPEGATIQNAIEYSGYRMVRGCGCRGGFCGSCATVYRIPGDHRLKVGMACQTKVEPEMTFFIMPYYPVHKPHYDLTGIDDPANALHRLYPELFSCLGCSACTKICPEDLEVMDYIAAAQRGNLAGIAEMSLDCIMCGLCASRCLAQLVPYQIAMTARRLHSFFGLPRPPYVDERIREVKEGKYVPEIDQLMAADIEHIQELYAARDIESI